VSWSWSFVPTRLMSDERFLGLRMEDRGVLYALYHRADRWGRGPGDPMALRIALGIVDGFDAASSLQRLAEAGLAMSYTVDRRRYWQLEQYDDDAPADVIRKRGEASGFPPPPSDYRQPVGATEAPQSVQPDPEPETEAPSGQAVGAGEAPVRRPRRDETRRDEKRQDETPASAGRARPPAHEPAPAPGPGPAPPPPPAHVPAALPARESYPDAKAAAAADRWTRQIRQLAPTLSVGDESLVPLALEVGSEVFVRAVELHFDAEPQFWRKYPLKALRERCRWAAERIVEEKAAPPPRAPPQGRQQWPPPAPAAAASAPAAAPDRSHLPVVERRVVISELCPNDGCVALRNWLKGQREPRDVQRLESVVATVIEPQPGAPHLSTFREASWRELSEPDREAVLAAFPAYEARMRAPARKGA
jgi:hypothetical protein